MLKKQQKSHPRHYGKDSHLCRVTKNANGVIRKYGLLMTRRAFREQAEHIGFKKVTTFIYNHLFISLLHPYFTIILPIASSHSYFIVQII